MPLPSYMERIRAHLLADRGMSEEKATATAIATATLFCRSGRSPNLPVHVNAASRAEACAAVAELRAQKVAKVGAKQKEEPVAKVTDKPWDGSPSRFTDEQYARSCVLDRGPSVSNVKERYSLPVREPDGTVNLNALSAAASRISTVKASAGVIAKAARALVALYRAAGKTPPPESLVKLAGRAATAGAAASAAHSKGQQRALPEPGEVEERSAPDTLDLEGRTLHGTIPYNVESRELPGGWREIMRPGSLRNADLADLVVTVDHAGLPLGRYPLTLHVSDDEDALRWSVELPDSPHGESVRAAVERGDLNGASWRMIVGRDSWQGNTRYVEEVRALRDVSLATRPAYPAAIAELRAAPETELEEARAMETEEQVEHEEEELRSEGGGGLRVEERAEHGGEIAGTLHARFKRAGFAPGVRAEIGWEEFLAADEQRAVTWTGSVDSLAPIRREAVPLGADRRYAWPAFGSVAVDPGATSVDVLTQTARTLPAAASVVRAIDATSAKPEADSTVTVETVPLKQVAAVQKGIPNVYMQSNAIRNVIGQDLRLAVNSGLDLLVLDALATAPFHDPTTDALLVSIRKCITILQDAGYNPDTLILTPADAEALDVLTTSGPEAAYVFGPGRFSPGDLFGLNPRISKDAPEAIVADAAAFGKLYSSPIGLQTFEENAGETNTSLMRMEGHAAFGVERVDAAVRIAAA